MTPATTHRQPIETSRVLNVQAAELSSPTQAWRFKKGTKVGLQSL